MKLLVWENINHFYSLLLHFKNQLLIRENDEINIKITWMAAIEISFYLTKFAELVRVE